MRQVYFLETVSKDNISEKFYVTDDHPWLNSAHVWVATKDLTITDLLETASGEDHKVKNIFATNQFAQTYNLTIANNHTFLVGNGQFVVHNMSCDPKRFFKGALRDKVMKKGLQPDGSIKCAYCDKKATQADHINAWKNGGKKTLENGNPSCPSFNSSKGAKDVNEWLSNRKQ